MINFIISKIKTIKFRLQWRLLNKHNFTVAASVFPVNNVKVGKMSYGPIDVKCFGNTNEGLVIGDYVSIANNVLFLLGGNHQTNSITSYPLYSKLIEVSPELDAMTKGQIVIGNEVWIGNNALILSGVSVGKGAIIAAGSVVTKNVDAYSIVGGNPAKLIRFRFNEEILGALKDFNLSDYDEDVIKNNIGAFYSTLEINQLEKIKKINKR